MRKKIVFAFLMLLSIVFTKNVAAQDFGADPDYCKKNLSLYDQYYKQNDFVEAIKYWREAVKSCPKSTKNLYLHGTKIVEYFIQNATDPAVKEAYIDTLMLVYDWRIEYFGQRGVVIGKKGVDLLKYRSSSVEEAYNYLKESISLQKNESEGAVLTVYMQATNIMFKSSKIQGQDVIDNYVLCLDILNARLAVETEERTKEILTKAKENVDKLFEDSGAATCESLVQIFGKRFEENPENIEVLKLTTRLLDKFNCKESELFAKASESLYKLEPSPEAAINLARLFMKKADYTTASKYYEEAIAGVQDPMNKAQYYYELAVITKELDQFAKSRTYARSAIELRPDFGEAYILIGDMYASTRGCGDNDVSAKFVYIAAINQYRQARSVSTNATVQENASQRIGTYRGHLPKTEDAFFYGYTKGQSYTVGCWIGETISIEFVD